MEAEASMDARVTIRPARGDEIEALAELHAGHDLFRRYGLTTATLAATLRSALARGEHLLVAEADGATVGFAWWVAAGAFARSPYLRLIVVAAARSGGGIGARLMDAVEGAAFAVATDVFLLVTADNAGARRFYAGRGFEPIGTVHDYVAPGVDEVIMRKRRST